MSARLTEKPPHRTPRQPRAAASPLGIQAAPELRVVLAREGRVRAEAAGPPADAALGVLRACREVHRAAGAERTVMRPSGPGDEGASGAAPADEAADATLALRAELERAEAQLSAALDRLLAGSADPGEDDGRR